jgi:hypothetical protein
VIGEFQRSFLKKVRNNRKITLAIECQQTSCRLRPAPYIPSFRKTRGMMSSRTLRVKNTDYRCSSIGLNLLQGYFDRVE